ncbi:hypothetical protein, partial [Ruegeria sp. Ofav3-42]|uniref:hypothetical protein n=1 Tax=Ruegeria sp. Ofav3-42 TaxID=2917759 RepID=UPI001EF66D19
AEFIKASGDNAATQTGRTDEGTDKIPANITRKLLQCRSHPQRLLPSYLVAAGALGGKRHFADLGGLITRLLSQ